MVHLDYDEELGPLHGMYGSMEAELGVQRPTKRAELTAFLSILKKVTGPIKVHVDNKGIVDGLWKGESKCLDPKTGDADLWIKMLEELQLLASREISVEVEHVKAHRAKNDKKEMSCFDKFVTEGNEKKPMSWQRQEQCWMKDLRRKQGQKRCSKREKKIQLSLFGGRVERL